MAEMTNISFASDETVGALHANPKQIIEYIKDDIYDSNWLSNIVSGNIFEERKTKIPVFELKISPDGKYKDVALENAIILYENLKSLPRVVLTDERFWVWLELSKYYRVAIQAMRPEQFEGTWIFTHGLPRSIFFNTFARSYFWVEYTVNESNLDNKYEYTKFVFDKAERIRNLTFDTSKSPHIIYSTVKAEKMLYDKYNSDPEYSEAFSKAETGFSQPKCNIYTKIRKDISLFGSARILDGIPESELTNIIFDKLVTILEEVKKGNLDILK